MEMKLITTKKLLEMANAYLRQEMAKRWEMTKIRDWSMDGLRKKHEAALTKEGYLLGFKIIEYHPLKPTAKVILRLKEKYKDFRSPPSLGKEENLIRHFNADSPEKNRRQADGGGLEISFLMEEIETVVPWVLDNYLAAKSVPDWLCDAYAHKIKLGEPVFQYHWTKKAWGEDMKLPNVWNKHLPHWEGKEAAACGELS